MRKRLPGKAGAGPARHSRKTILWSAVVLILLALSLPARATVLQPGTNNQVVLQVQQWLVLLGYLKHQPTGYYGALTEQAVKAFQAEQNVVVDGVVGRETFSLLRERICQTFSSADLVSSNPDSGSLNNRRAFYDPAGKNTRSIPETFPVHGELLSWDQVKQVFLIGDTAQVLDLETGLSFRIYRHGGHLHADCEPLSPKDTAIMFAVFGGKWSWERRAVIVEVGEHRIAASLNGQPHGRYSLKDNNFFGHFCVHFYQSRLHKNGKIDPTHQRMILKAAGIKESKDL
ncbi:MAG TPA: peptidoglycan-binding domain-containing protein [Bacillota bacterium]